MRHLRPASTIGGIQNINCDRNTEVKNFAIGKIVVGELRKSLCCTKNSKDGR